jgi:hypothetical protein
MIRLLLPFLALMLWVLPAHAQPKGYPYLNPTQRPTADPAKWSNNLWFGAGAAPSWDTNPLNADPKLVSSASPYDLHLRASSPAIGAGVATPSFAPSDFDGLSCPASSTSDNGAYHLRRARAVQPEGACPENMPLSVGIEVWKPHGRLPEYWPV